jgi:phosphohistidine phosphatase
MMPAVTAEPHRLHLLRHTKSSWAEPPLDDHERPLAPRGRRAATALAEHFGRVGAAPRLVLCSSARRAVETLDHVRSGLPAGLPVSIEMELYGATEHALLERVRQVPEETAVVLVVGHNPGLEDLARGLVDGGDPRLLDRLRTKYPTGALATVVFPGTWRALDWGRATLDAFVVPSDLGA